MKATIAWWNLDKSDQTIGSLRQHLKDEWTSPWESVDGLRLKIWISDPDNNLWGALMLWEASDFMSQPLPPNHAAKLIGYPATLRFTFDVDAIIEGNYSQPLLNRLGLSFEEC